MNPIPLAVNDLTIARGGIAVLSGLSFHIDPGHALILRGPNGSGKTTLLRTIAGLQPPLDGTISGADDQIAYMAHADGIKPTLTVAENLTFWAAVFGSRSIDAALNAFDMTGLAHRRAGLLSAGQKRRLGLSRLVVTDRPVWILDEPTVSLDRSTVDRFSDLVVGHLSDGGIALMATHIDLGVEAAVLDVSVHRARADSASHSDEAFL